MLGVMVLLCAIAVPVAVGKRSDSGGPNIASAPELPLGHQVTGGTTLDARGNYQEYWAVSTLNGDILHLVTSSTSAAGVVVCLYTPAVTDANLVQADCRQTESIAGQGLQTFTFTLASAGRWTLAIRGSVPSQPFSYAATGTIVHQQPPSKSATTTRLKLKRQARLRTPVLIAGSVTLGATGRVRLQARLTGQSRWTTLARPPLTASSQFGYTAHFTRVGVYRVRASYGGDAQHFPSAAEAAIRITR
jgi:hypothetical protein